MLTKELCIFCLEDSPKTQKYDPPCNCAPYTHIRCLKKWFDKYPNECPLCRINYEGMPIDIKEPEYIPSYKDNIILILLIMTPSLVFILLYASGF